MPDSKEIRRPLDNKRVDINDPQEVRNWCNALGCTENELGQAVQAVGTSAEAVKDYLNN